MAANAHISGSPSTYHSGSDSSDSEEAYSSYRTGHNNLLAELKADEAKSPDSAIQPTVCDDYYDVDEDDTAADLLSRQVMVRKMAASENVSKLLCDEVDGAIADAPASIAELATDSISRALSRGKSMGGIGNRSRGGMARSKSQFGSAARAERGARARSAARGLDNQSDTMNEMMNQGDAVRRVVRTRGDQAPAALGPRSMSNKSNGVGGGRLWDESMNRKPTLDMLNAMADDEPVSEQPRKQMIRFA